MINEKELASLSFDTDTETAGRLVDVSRSCDRDERRWIHRLFEAKKRYGVCAESLGHTPDWRFTHTHSTDASFL